jgi:hypothetical protein
MRLAMRRERSGKRLLGLQWQNGAAREMLLCPVVFHQVMALYFVKPAPAAAAMK